MLRASSVPATPSPPRVGRLDTLARVRLEMTRLYREARTGKLDSQEATRLAFILQSIARLIEGGDFERRLDEIEKKVAATDASEHSSTTPLN
jgi:hypothetical protein